MFITFNFNTCISNFFKTNLDGRMETLPAPGNRHNKFKEKGKHGVNTY
jgi:hypothetical protein